ncbi:class I SAM-dependent methyltransferase [Lysinibacillus piscis]|uniref:Class I SAM-dependent methyltransferase n=1 Tax=Lysinibacillus piscis TaxID=2518931 RepID=A0ABQ5NHG9_9BACI|nr:class I SAM-dependent methyltransferase [Lysinibacillus sp. KH24]GLC87810.1 hypothetical protein LYSBPC_09370 [Lysinibacillus sp. KH24]
MKFDKMKESNIYIYGIGSVYEKYKFFLDSYNVCGLICNDENYWGKMKDNKYVFDPQSIEFSNCFIIIMSSFIEEISKELERNGLEYGNDFCTYIDLDTGFNLHKILETGHFYSPIPNTSEIFSENYKPYERNDDYLGINLNLQTQKDFVYRVNATRHEFNEFLEKNHDLFYLNNGYFGYVDSITYFTFINHFKPQKIIEVGSGFTSALALGTSIFCDLEIDFTFIEPYPERIKKLLEGKKEMGCLLEDIVQNIPISTFSNLNENDFLFIDSSHVSKINSDVNYLFFEVLPNLKKGTIIHIHDIFTQFEYPLDWIYNGRFWNENYILRAFLQYNNQFEILCFNNFAFDTFKDIHCLDENLLIDGHFGGSIWLRRI